MNTVKPKMNTMKKGGTSRAPKKKLAKAQRGKEVNKFKPSAARQMGYDLMDAMDSGLKGNPNYLPSIKFVPGTLGKIQRSVDSLDVQDRAYGRYTPPKTQYQKAVKDAKNKNPKLDFNKVGGSTKAKPMMKKGGSMPMVKKDGKMVPAFAADGKGKMMYGGAKKSMMKKGGATRKK